MLNGMATEKLSSSLHFTFYKDSAFGVARLHPLGGPVSGGTLLHVYIVDARLLVDLGGSAHGPFCRFAYDEPTLSHHEMLQRSELVQATLADCGGMRSCGAGGRALRCVVPPYAGQLEAGVADVGVEVTVNGRDFSITGQVYRYFDPTLWRVHSFAPRGGPLLGNTSVVATTSHLQSLGDTRCRFGDHLLASEVDASIQSSTRLACDSPSHWEQSQATQQVEFQVTLNGQDWMQVGGQRGIFTFYALDEPRYGLGVHHLSPNGGPSAGGTLVEVHGSGFVDMGGLLCAFSGEAAVEASRVSDTLLQCNAPKVSVLKTNVSEPRALKVLLNGQRHSATTSDVLYRYFASSSFGVARLHPLGGPVSGGTLLHVYIVDARLLVDLGGSAHGPFCRFAYDEPTLSHHEMLQRSELVQATLADCGGMRSCGAGGRALRCVVPPYAGQLEAGVADVGVEVTVNGRDFSITGQVYRYFDPTLWRVHSFAPRGGPLLGNTSVVATTSHLQSLGDTRCRFGDHLLASEVDASIQSSTRLACDSPSHWEQSQATQQVEFQVTLNGQDWMQVGGQRGIFTFYALDEPRYGLGVHHLSPNGGPSAGGTLVEVHGSGFVDMGGLLCAFSGEAAVEASRVSDTLLRCNAPATELIANSTFDPRVVELTLNGQLRALTSFGTTFHYYSTVRVMAVRIYPRGGSPSGGTLVTVWGTGFQDLDHGAGLRCLFGASSLVPATRVSSPNNGEDRLLCSSPPAMPQSMYNVTGSADSASCHAEHGSTTVRVTLNGMNPSEGSSALTAVSTAASFTYMKL